MTPREVDELTPEEYRAMLDRIVAENREAQRQERKARRRR